MTVNIPVIWYPTQEIQYLAHKVLQNFMDAQSLMKYFADIKLTSQTRCFPRY